MSDIVVDLPEGMGQISFPAGTSTEVMNREASNAYLRLRGAAKGKADASNKSDSTAQAFAGGALQGAGDEAAAFVRSRLPAFSNWMMQVPALQRDESISGAAPVPPQTVSDAPTAEGRYEEELARERAKSQQFRKDNPKTSIGATVAGSIAPFIPLAAAGVPIAPSMSGGFVGNTLKAAGTGAVYGGLAGFNEGEGGLENRLESGGKGAAVGAALAPPLMWAGQGGRAVLDYAKTTAPGQAVLKGVEKATSALDRLGSVKPKSLSAAAPDGAVPGDNMATYAADQIRSVIPTAEDALKRRAAQYIATAVERGEMTVEQAATSLEKLGAGGVLADVSKSLFRVARMTNTLPGKTENVAEKVLTDRATTYNPRMRSAIEGQNPPPEDVFFRGDLPEFGGNILDKTAREVGQRAYQGEMVAGGLKQSPEMLKIMSNPKISGAWDRVMASLKEARVGTDRAPESPVEVMHMIKREIQNIGLDGATGRPSSTAYQWQQTADDFVRAVKKANPKLAEADVAYAKVKGLPDAYEVGLGTFGKGTTAQGGIDRTAAAVENMLKSADVMKINAAEFGAINAGRAKTGGNEADAVSFARDISQSAEVRRKIKAVFGERADEIFSTAEAILRFNKTKQGVLGGSQTTDKAAEVVFGGLDGNSLSVKATPGGIVPRFFETAGDIIRKVTAPNEATRDRIGSMLFNADPATNAETMALLNQIFRERSLQRQGGAVWGGLAGGNASGNIP